MRTWSILLTAVALSLFAVRAQAGHFCDHCGCQRDCKKVCRVEVKKKEKKETEYSLECEDFCVPGPSKRCSYLVDDKCKGHPQRKFIWQPTCAKVYTRKKLVKNEVKKEVPDYKWVVEEYCCVCGHYIKVEDQEKAGDDKPGEKDKKDKGGDGKGDAYKKAEWPPASLFGDVGEEIRVGDRRGYYWGDAGQDPDAGQPWPPAIRGSGSTPAARFSWVDEKTERR
jgi:hypothetical protein